MFVDACRGRRSTQQPFHQRGKLLIAFNEWMSYYNVRMNNLELRAGREMIVKVKMVDHVASERIRGLNIDSRNCLFINEQQVIQYDKTHYND
jgi:hypothetical protein